MLGQWIWSVVIVVMVAVLTSQTFPARRAVPAAPTLATMEWKARSSAMPRSFQEVTDIATCREMHRQIEQTRDAGDNRITLACHPNSVASASTL
jgi:hypothetical protein